LSHNQASAAPGAFSGPAGAKNGAASGQNTLVLVGAENGLAVIPMPPDLSRLNYYDGKFLRAADLLHEQTYLRRLVELSNRAGGSGVVHGFDLDVLGGSLRVGAGLAVDPQGHVLHLPHGKDLNVRQLIERSRAVVDAGNGSGPAGQPGFPECEVSGTAAPGPQTAVPDDLYLVSIGHAEALCGEEDVYGRLCEEACTTSTGRPYVVEGIVVRAVPLDLPEAACRAAFLDRRHRRAQVASAYFADERARLGRPMSRARLEMELWCNGAAAEAGGWLPLGVLAMSGDAVHFVDAWIARRERIATPPRRYWHWQMGMRPEPVFLAQVLQFQCHLRDVLGQAPSPGGDGDPCGSTYTALQETRQVLDGIDRQYEAARLKDTARVPELIDPSVLLSLSRLRLRVKEALTVRETGPAERILIDAGITELPPAGYLPVVPGTVDVATQARRLMGKGVDVRVCAVRADYVPHALEEAQHMDRICLLHGLENAARKPQVDVLVPDGVVERPAAMLPGIPLETAVQLRFLDFGDESPDSDPSVLRLRGAARAELAAGGGVNFHFAGDGGLTHPTRTDDGPVETLPYILNAVRYTWSTATREEAGAAGEPVTAERAAATSAGTTEDPVAAWVSASIGHDPFSLRPGQSTTLRAEVGVVTKTPRAREGGELFLSGDLFCDSGADGSTTLTGRVQGTATFGEPGDKPETEFLNGSCSIVLRPTSTGGGTAVVTLRLAQVEVSFSFAADWSARPTVGRVTATSHWPLLLKSDPTLVRETISLSTNLSVLSSLATSQAVEFGSVHFRESADVRRPENYHHAAALRALDELESYLEQPGYRERGVLRLFPAPVEAPEGGLVRATRDWVLFHRRRVSSCDCVCHPEPLPVVERTYRVYHFRVPDDAGAAALRELLESGRAIEGLRTVPVVPTFEGTQNLLLTPRSQVHEAWRAVDPADELVYGAVAAGDGARADGRPAQSTRLERLSSVVNDVTPDPRAVYDVLDAVPAQLDVGGVDGVMVFATRAAPVRMECVEVYALADARRMGEVLNQTEEAGFAAARERQQLVRLGSVQFAVGDAGAVSGVNEVAGAWDSAFAGRVPQATAVVLPPRGGDEVLALQRGTAVTRHLEGSGTEAVVRSAADDLGACGTVLVVAPGEAEVQTTCQTVVVLEDTAQHDFPLQRVLVALRQGNLDEALSQPGVHHAGAVTFVAGTAEPRFTDGDVRAMWAAAGRTGAPTAAITTRHTGSSDPMEVIAARTGVLVRALTDAQLASHAFELDVQTDCPGMTVLVQTVEQQTTCHAVYRVEHEAMPDLQKMIFSGQVAAGIEQLATLLGSVAFHTAGGVVPETLDAVVQAWAASGGGEAEHALPVVGRHDDGDRARQVEQTNVIGQRVQAPPATLNDVIAAGDVDLPGGCEMITLLAAPPTFRVGRVAAHTQGDVFRVLGTDPSWQVRFRADGGIDPLSAAAVDALRAILTQFRASGFNEVWLVPRETTPDADAAARLDRAFTSFASTNLLARDANGNVTANRRVRTRGEIPESLRLFDADGVRADDMVLLSFFLIT
jgi:hypothetical protein